MNHNAIDKILILIHVLNYKSRNYLNYFFTLHLAKLNVIEIVQHVYKSIYKTDFKEFDQTTIHERRLLKLSMICFLIKVNCITLLKKDVSLEWSEIFGKCFRICAGRMILVSCPSL